MSSHSETWLIWPPKGHKNLVILKWLWLVSSYCLGHNEVAVFQHVALPYSIIQVQVLLYLGEPIMASQNTTTKTIECHSTHKNKE